MQRMNIGICGLGTVACGVINVWQRNQSLLTSRAVQNSGITHIGARRDNPACDTHAYTVSRDIFAVVNDPSVDVVVELIGGIEPARQLVMEAIAAGKHVVTANKALIAEHGDEILAAAALADVEVRFEAAVAGGIPVIKALTEGLSGNAIESIVGIINGTGNYILTEMREKNRSFEDALADAQRLGYAEADPTYDVEGIDAAQKLTILAALAYGTPLDANRCYTEGISAISVEDMTYANELGYCIKHLGIARATEQGLEMRVHPALIPKSRLIANVNGVLNAVAIHGDAVGPTLFCGAGAGAEPTASAVIADIVDLSRKMACGSEASSDVGAASSVQKENVQDALHRVVPITAIHCAYYLRIAAANRPGVLSQITQVLSDADISVEGVRQHEHTVGAHAYTDESVPIVLTTNVTLESNFRAAVAQIEKLDTVLQPVSIIRIESVD